MKIIIQSLEIIASIFIAMLVAKMLVDIMFYIAKKILKRLFDNTLSDYKRDIWDINEITKKL